MCAYSPVMTPAPKADPRALMERTGQAPELTTNQPSEGEAPPARSRGFRGVWGKLFVCFLKGQQLGVPGDERGGWLGLPQTEVGGRVVPGNGQDTAQGVWGKQEANRKLLLMMNAGGRNWNHRN